MNALLSILLIASFVIAIVIVNTAQKLWMNLLGIDMMFFSMKKKLAAIFIVGIIVFGLAARVFGIGS